MVHPSPRQKCAKVFEIKELSLDHGLGYGAKVESPACAGLWFLPDLIVAGVSRGWPGKKGVGPLIPECKGKARAGKVWVERSEGLCPGDFFGDPSPFDYARGQDDGRNLKKQK